MTITMITTEQKLNTQGKYIDCGTQHITISEERYKRMINQTSMTMSRQLGGEEDRKDHKLISTSPDKQTRIIREFEFN